MSWESEFTDEQKAKIAELIIYTVKEIREQIARDIMVTADLWLAKKHLKSRRTSQAFLACASIARGENEKIRK